MKIQHTFTHACARVGDCFKFKAKVGDTLKCVALTLNCTVE